jgi:hypothetical protein
VDPSCKGLRRGFNQTFHFRNIKGTDDRSSIAKTFDGHAHEALRYGALECGSTEAKYRAKQVEQDQRRRIESNLEAKRYNRFGGSDGSGPN